MKFLKYLITIGWIVSGLYLGIAGWQGTKALQKISAHQPDGATTDQSVEFEGLNFRDNASLRQFLRQRESNRWFPWIFIVPQDITPLIATIAFGLLGGAARLLKRLALDSEELSTTKLFSDPLFGGILGLAVFFLSLLLPALFTGGKSLVPLEVLVAVSFLGGIFSEHAYDWIEKQVKRFFSSRAPRGKKKGAK